MTDRPYHHGNLRRALLAAAVEAIEQNGHAALSLRDLARRAGVSHAAPTHHFGDKTGLLTALAAQGYDLLADALDAAGDEMLEAGVAYVRFAVDHRAHFEVMFQPGLYHRDDPHVAAARSRADQRLADALSALPDPPVAEDRRAAELAAWSIVHGFASLWLSGALPTEPDDDPGTLARTVIRRLFEHH
ncbi:TetR/AcrR family transcriptional regulator [Streptomyces sp. NBC_01142]|uniref:TetR/AcrR family transcriptional regulator n=1 Tax=Streptomyces sp. NBC_01142 TaxID=2975865 RepID=UPI002256CA21|nr:TetR/AcrR family transcriptional regulator [Streptomyces sp. NBC_01142]MCX4821204.1 TetR/AcrR family transcriptional regulator [Streptomyces sp. NBC_01142]